MIVTKNELTNILKVNINTLNSIIKRNKLEYRLKKNGYNLISKKKEGRVNKYEIEEINYIQDVIENTTNALFRTYKKEELGNYILYRSNNIDLPITLEMLKNLCNVSRKTIGKWDNVMLNHGLMSKYGYFYIAKDYNKDGQLIRYRITDKYEYDSFCRCSKYAKKKKEIGERYKKDEISFDEMELMIEGINEYAKISESKFVYRINKYNMDKDENILLMQLIDFYERKHKKSLNNYRQTWLEDKLK